LAVFKKPPDPDILAKIRKRKVKVLDEDDYVDKVEKIIEKDFFPELEKLKAQNEYIEAKEKNDVVTMNRLQEKYSGIRPGTGRLDSPATFETPMDLHSRETDPKRGDGLNKTHPEFETPLSGGGREGIAPSLAGSENGDKGENLDSFLSRHTSEDNESFHEIQAEAEKKHRIKMAWMYKDERVHLENKALQMELPSIEQQGELPKKPLDVETWTYQNINSVFHNPDSLELTEEEKISLAKKQKEIVHDNTRVTKTPWKTEKQMEALRREAEKQKEIASGKVGIDGKELVRPDTPSVNGFKLFSMTPSPYVGVEDSPLMTWGEVDTTPYRLEGCATPLPPSHVGGPSFTIKDVPKRDRIAKELADKNSRYYRERKTKAIEQVKSSIKGGRMKTGQLAGMSPAAQRLASKKLGIRLGTDDMLRASYTPTPHRAGATPTPRATPGRGTPSGKTPSKAGVTPTLGAKSGAKLKTPGGSGASLTDDLLNLPKEKVSGHRSREAGQISTDNLLNLGNVGKRTRAQDYFMKPKE